MSAVEKAIDEIRLAIPYEILNEAFKIDMGYVSGRTSGIQTSLSSRIREDVINKKVLVDCNLMGGKEVVVPLDSLPKKTLEDNTYVIKIPLKLTGGLAITSTLSVAHITSGLRGLSGVNNTTTPVDGAFSNLANADRPSQLTIPNSKVSLIGDNTVYIRLPDIAVGDLFLRCRVSNDPDMATLPPTSWLGFSKLSILATKAYIYNKLIIRIDEGQLQGGLNLGAFKQMVDNYSDALTLYNEYLSGEWVRVMALGDEVRHSRAINFQFGMI